MVQCWSDLFIFYNMLLADTFPSLYIVTAFLVFVVRKNAFNLLHHSLTQAISDLDCSWNPKTFRITFSWQCYWETWDAACWGFQTAERQLWIYHESQGCHRKIMMSSNWKSFQGDYIRKELRSAAHSRLLERDKDAFQRNNQAHRRRLPQI